MSSASPEFTQGCPFATGVDTKNLSLQQAAIGSDHGVAVRWVDGEGNTTPWVKVMCHSDAFGTDEYSQSAESADARIRQCPGVESKARFLGCFGTVAVCGAFGTAEGESPTYSIRTYCTDPGF